MPSSTLTRESQRTCQSSLPSLAGCSGAIIAFCRLNGLKERLTTIPLPQPLLTSLEPSSQFVGYLDNSPILVLECLMGEEVLPAVVAELASLGIKTVIGYGYAASLTSQIPPGQVVLAESAVQDILVSHSVTYPYHRLFQDVRSCALRQCLSIRRARFLQADPTELDYLDRIAHRRDCGVEMVHRDVMTFYHACRSHSLFGLFLSVVADSLEKQIEGPDVSPVHQGMKDLQHLVCETLIHFHTHAPNCG